jgi:hypothetical protein
MEAVQQAKQEADDAYRIKQYATAVSAYSRALELSEQQQRPDILHLLYSNRSAAKLALQDFTGALADAQASVAVDDRWVTQQLQQTAVESRLCLTVLLCPHTNFLKLSNLPTSAGG